MKTRLFVPLALMIAGPPAFADPPPEPRLDVIKYDALASTIRKLRGKVVVVDFWADYCLPCRREFPRLVELHSKHARAGLAVVSVSLDENEDAHRARVLAFLKKQDARFRNYLLDEQPTVWQSKLKTSGPPLVFVFNRKGELVRRFADAEVDYEAVGKLVTRLLND